MLATGGYDHSIRIFNAFTSSSKTSLQHNDSQVNCLAFSNSSNLAAGGFQSIKIYDYNASNNPVVNFDQVNK
jgi:target of rapamycin complex subunit LST8